jgi:hypothetical protein
MKRIASSIALAIVVAACGGSTSASGTYTVAFQSTDEAVAAESIDVHVYDASTIATNEPCGHLLALRDSNQDLPPAVVELPPTTPCDLRAGAGTFSAPFASVAVLVVAHARDTGGPLYDLARGCATQRLSEDVTEITVDLALVSGRSVAPTKCTSLSQHCSGGC